MTERKRSTCYVTLYLVATWLVHCNACGLNIAGQALKSTH